MYGLSLALLSAVLFGASTPASKALLGSLEPFQLAGLLYLGAALGMAPLVALERRVGARLRLDRANAARLAGAVLFGGVLGAGAPARRAAAHARGLGLAAPEPRDGRDRGPRRRCSSASTSGALGWLGVGGVVAAGALVAGAGGWPGLAGALLTAAACAVLGARQPPDRADRRNHARAQHAREGRRGGRDESRDRPARSRRSSPTPGDDRGGARGRRALVRRRASRSTSRAAHELGATRAQAVFASAPVRRRRARVRRCSASRSAPAHVAACAAARSVDRRAVPEPARAPARARGARARAQPPARRRPPPPRASGRARRRCATATRTGTSALVHAHPHWPDLHHRHVHSR